MRQLLILTLSAGESALPTLKTQLASQTFSDFDHEVIAGLANKEAHDRLYQIVMDGAASYELFLKIDADMTLRRPTALADVVQAVARHPDIQHFAFPIFDFFTEEETLGVHLYRAGVRWNTLQDDLFVDPHPPASLILWEGPPAPFVNHGELASDFECFSFGVHKFLKVAQRERGGSTGRQWKGHKFTRHFRNCLRIRALCHDTRARRHMLALVGILWTMEHEELSAMADKQMLQHVFDSEIVPNEARWLTKAERAATNPLAWRLALVRSLGLRAFARTA